MNRVSSKGIYNDLETSSETNYKPLTAVNLPDPRGSKKIPAKDSVDWNLEWSELVIEKEIGKGAFGTVFKATCLKFHCSSQ